MGKSILLLDGFSKGNDDLMHRRKLMMESSESNSDMGFEIDLECEISSSVTALVQNRTQEMFDFLIRCLVNLVFCYLQFILQYSHTYHAPKTSRFEKQTRCHKMKEIVFIDSQLTAWIIEEVLQGLHSSHYSSNQDTHFVGCSFPETIRRLGFLFGSAESQDRTLISLVLSHHRHQKDYCSSLDFIPLFDSLATNTTLKHLNISGLQVNDKSAESLVRCLQENHTLQTLKLTDCGLSSTSITLLLKNLGPFFGLRRLYLNGYQKHHCQGLLGCQELVDLAVQALKTQNCTLEALFMPPGFDSFRSELDVLLDWNLGGRRIMLRHNHNRHQTPAQYPTAIRPRILERVNTLKLPNGCQQTKRRRAARRADMIFLMLRQHFLLEG